MRRLPKRLILWAALLVPGAVAAQDAAPATSYQSVRSVAVAPITPLSAVLVTPEWVGPAELLRSTDGGGTWKTIVPGGASKDNFVFASSVFPYAVFLSRLGVEPHASFRSTDGGVTFDGVKAERPFGIESLAPHPTDPAILFAGAGDAQVWKGTDGGASFATVYALPFLNPLAYRCRAVAIAPSSPSTVYAGFTVAGAPSVGPLARSTDAGASWALAFPGIPIETLAVDPEHAEVIYAGGGPQSGASKSTDAGASWKELGDGLPDVPVLTLAFLSWTGSTLWAGTATGLHRSTDGGVTFAASKELAGLEVRSLAEDTEAGSILERPSLPILYAGTSGGLFRSTDAGRSWAQRKLPLPAPGDVNGDGAVNVNDVLELINHLFAGGAAPGAGDVNGDGVLSIADILALINRVFAGG